VHPELQQTPSAVQKLLLQSLFALQPIPLESLVPHWLLVLRQVSLSVQSKSEVQVVRHDGLLALHSYGLHACVVASGQLPLPSQLADGVSVLPVQLAGLQPVLVDQGRQAPPPSQVPSFEQSPLAALLATQSFFGSAPPAGTGEHVPTLPETLQLRQRPPVVASLHAELQQTPSVQKLLSHWLPAVQAAPGGFRPHELFAQVLGTTQSASVLQMLSQAAEEQIKVPHV
jgi:hypothetical protein